MYADWLPPLCRFVPFKLPLLLDFSWVFAVKVANPRLQADGLKAQGAAAEAVDNFEDEDDILGEGFVRLNIGDQTPKVHTNAARLQLLVVRHLTTKL